MFVFPPLLLPPFVNVLFDECLSVLLVLPLLLLAAYGSLLLFYCRSAVFCFGFLLLLLLPLEVLLLLSLFIGFFLYGLMMMIEYVVVALCVHW